MQQSVNILMLGGAKRVSMARMFKAAGAKSGLDVNLFSYELTKTVPVAEVATVICGLRWNNPDLLDDLHRVVTENGINIIIPFVDPAVEIAARYCESDKGCFTPMTDADKARLMFDKIEADAVFRSLGIPVPANACVENFDGAVIAKPRCGSASKGIKVLDAVEFEAFKLTPEASGYLFQQYLAEHEEITVDCYVSRGGEVVCAVPRLRLDVVGGEVLNTKTISDPEIEGLSTRILGMLCLRGSVTLQFLRERFPNGTLGKPLLMEINPRLGGGAVCSVHAGADIPAYILADYLEEKVEKAHWRSGVMICRYMQEVVFNL